MSVESLYAAFEFIPDMVFITELHTLHISYANHVAQQITGLAHEQLQHLTVPELHPEHLRNELAQRFYAISTTEDAHFEYEGELVHYASANPTVIAMKINRLEIDQRYYVLAIGRDITQNHAAQAELQKSAILYSALIDGLSDLMFRITEDGVYRDFHIPASSGLDIPAPDNIIGRTVAEVVPPHVTEIAMPAIRAVVRTGKPQTVEYSIEEADGLHHYEARFVPSILDEIIAVVHDITARKEKAEALRFSEKMARALLDASSDSAILIDPEWKILSMNGTAAERFNRTVEEMVGTRILDYFPPEAYQSRTQAAVELFATKKPVEFEDTRGGRQIANRASPILNEKGEIVQVAVFSRDITRQRRQENELREQHDLLEGVAAANYRLLTPGDYEHAIQEALHIIGRATDVDRVYMFRNHFDPETNEPLLDECGLWISDRIAERHNIPTLINLSWVKNGYGRWYDLMRQGKEVYSSTRNLPEHERENLERDLGPFSLLTMPIFVDHQFWGFISLDDARADRPWTKAKIDLIRTMAASLGGAIARRQLEDDLRQKRQFAETLREISNMLTLARHPEEVMAELLKQIKQVIDYDTASAMLVDEKKNIARIVAIAGLETRPTSEQPPSSYNIDQMPYMRLMMQTRRAYVSQDVTTDPNWVPHPSTREIKSWLSAPIVVGDQVRGFFALDSHQKHTYTKEYFPQIQSFAQQAAIALQNAWYVEDIKNLERVKSEIIAIASHDLRNPLMRIQALLTQLRDELAQHLTAEQYDMLARLLGSTRNMEHILTNILSLRRIEDQHRSSQPIYWEELLNNAVNSAREQLTQAQHTLVIEIAPNLPVTRGNAFKLERVIYNLLHNAIKYTPPGGHITLRAFEKPYGLQSTIAIEVEDNGIGLSEAEQANLFQPFYRAHQAGTEHIPGTGLGLSMVKTAIEEHNGNVYVDSIPGQGSLFGFWVPVLEVD